LNKNTITWLVLGVLGAVFWALVCWLLTALSSAPFSGYIIFAFAFFGALPGIFGAINARILGLVTFIGLFIAFLWGFVDVVFVHKGWIWPYFYLMTMVRVIFVLIVIGSILQLFFLPKKKKKRFNYSVD
jgi:hypothetical protein